MFSLIISIYLTYPRPLMDGGVINCFYRAYIYLCNVQYL